MASEISDLQSISSSSPRMTLRHAAGTILLIFILIVIVWANVEGKKKVWRRENVLTAFMVAVGAFAVWNTPFVSYMGSLLNKISPKFNNGFVLNALHFVVFFLVAISITYWAHKWLWPKVQKQMDDDEEAEKAANSSVDGQIKANPNAVNPVPTPQNTVGAMYGAFGFGN